MAENNIKDGLCYVNMLNFIEIKTLNGLKAENFLQKRFNDDKF